MRVAAVLDKGVLLLSVDMAGETEHALSEVVDGVDALTATSLAQALEIALLTAPEANDALFGEHVERERVDALLVDDDKGLAVAVAHLSLKLDDLPHLVVDELALALHQLFALIGV